MSSTNARLQGGGLILPQGSSPGNINVGEKSLIIDADGTLKTQDSAGTKAPISGAASFSPFYARMAALQASVATLTGPRYAVLGTYPAGVAIASRTNNQTGLNGPGVLATATPLAVSNNFIVTPKTVPWFAAFRAIITGGTFSGANYALCTTHDGTNDFVRFGYAGGTSNSFFSVDVGHGGSTTTGVSTIALDTNPHDHAVFYDGSTALKYYIDSVLAVTISTLTNFPQTAQSLAIMANTTALSATETYCAFNES